MNDIPQVYVALPILNESENISNLVSCFRDQEYLSFKIVVCVNQYDDWWQDEEKINECNDNQKSLRFLQFISDIDIHVIDRCSRGVGWPKKKGGVGWARKTIMDYISEKANKEDLIVSVDADTYYPPDYLKSIIDFFSDNKKLIGLSIPYYHKLNNDITDRLILRYEIYMRYYLLNMIRINNPFCFTALGSAMAFPVWAYRKAGGLTPVAAGEDFYFLQKLVKIGVIGIWASTIAYPSPRFSDRVSFGTGPALIKGNGGNWDSYPHYNPKDFDKVDQTYKLFKGLYNADMDTPMDVFLLEQTKSGNIWDPFRKNYTDEVNFIKACRNKVDGLRILQYLRKEHDKIKSNNEFIIYNYLHTYFKNEINLELLVSLKDFDYHTSEIKLLQNLRDFLFDMEMKQRKNRFVNID